MTLLQLNANLIGAAPVLGNALMLFFACAALIPLLIHLWSRRRFEERSFAAMDFLLRAMRHHAKRISIEHWLLLALRTFLLVVFVLALADPILPSVDPPLSNGVMRGGRHWVLVFDTSYSMQFEEQQKTRLTLAKEQAIELVESAPEGDAFSIITAGFDAEILINDPAYDRTLVTRQIQSIEIQHGSADLRFALGRVNDVLEVASYRRNQFEMSQVVFLTDLGANSWDAFEDTELRGELRTIGRAARLSVLDVAGAATENQFISDVRQSVALLVPGEPVRFEVAVNSFGQQESARRRISMHVDGVPVSEFDVVVSDAAGNVESFEHVFQDAGDHQVEFRLDSDALALDNSRWHVVTIRPQIRALVVGTREVDTKELSVALQPEGESSRKIDVLRITEQEWAAVNLADFDCVFLNNVSTIRRDEAERLKQFVSRGGGLVIALGGRSEPDDYNRLLGGTDGVLPATIEGIVDDSEAAFDPLDYEHPIVEPFRGFPGAGLLDTPIWRYAKLRPIEGREATRILEFRRGDPALMECEFGFGRCILSATPLGAGGGTSIVSEREVWNALPAWPSFVPLVQETLRFSIKGKMAIRNRTVGEPLYFDIAADSEVLNLTLPSGSRDTADRNTEPGTVGQQVATRSPWRFDRAKRTGIYRASESRPTAPSQLSAVNLDTQESRLVRSDPSLLPSQIELIDRLDADSTPHTSQPEPTHIYQWLLLLLLLLLIAECGLAFRAGRPFRAEARPRQRGYRRTDNTPRRATRLTSANKE